MKRKNEKRSRINGYTAENAQMLGIPVVNGVPQENTQALTARLSMDTAYTWSISARIVKRQ